MRKKHILLFLFIYFLNTANAQVIDLSGNWKVKLDSLDCGISEKWFSNNESFGGQFIKLPGTLDDAAIGNKNPIDTVLSKEVMQGLHRMVSYIGAAWYMRSFDINEGGSNTEFKLLLERVLWRSDVWIDGQKMGQYQNSMVAPHCYKIPNLKSGKHFIVVRIDNRKQHDISVGDRNMAHSYTDGTQIIWNGIIGKIQLIGQPQVFISDLQLYPEISKKTIGVKIKINNEGKTEISRSIKLVIREKDQANSIIMDTSISAYLAFGESTLNLKLPIADSIKEWNEFNPFLYTATASIRATGSLRSQNFGWRNLTNSNALLQINKTRLYLRGTLECAIFPLTGYPIMDKTGWLTIFSTAKSYGLNHLRFHSWCPPAAAFEAADEIGMYLQVELPVWSLTIGKIGSAGIWMENEADKMLEEYGNHPSFCFMSLGNELEGDFNYLASQVRRLKEKDNRRLYTTTSFTFQQGHGRWPEANDDFFITQYTKKGWVRGQGIFDQEPPAFNKDYRAAIEGMDVPLVSHEIGQYAVFPNLNEISKYKGVLKPVNFESVKRDMSKKGLVHLADDYMMATGKFAAILYKEEIERALKTPNSSGYQLLDLRDFPGQGTALVGMLDAFWDSKGFITNNEFKRFSGPVVPLIRFPKAVYENNEVFEATVEVANYSDKAIIKRNIKWDIRSEDGTLVASGVLKNKTILNGANNLIGNIDFSLIKIKKAERLIVSVRISDSDYQNSWNIWVYPTKVMPAQNEIHFTTTLEDAILRLDKGQMVLFNPAEKNIAGVDGKFVPVFWSPVHFPNQPGTMGLLLDNKHPAFNEFPTDNHSNWQWWDLCKRSKTMVLDSTGITEKAILLRVIDNFVKNRNLASVIELKVGTGKLLVCSMNISDEIGKRPVARQLRLSLMQYMKSSSFDPSITITKEKLGRLFISQQN